MAGQRGRISHLWDSLPDNLSMYQAFLWATNQLPNRDMEAYYLLQMPKLILSLSYQLL